MATAAPLPIVNSADLSASGSSDLFPESSVRDSGKVIGQVSGDAPWLLTGKGVVLPRQQRDQGYPASNVRVEILLPAYAPNPRPSQLLFGGLQDPGLQVQRAIPLEVCVEQSTVIVKWPEVDEFGTGDNLSGALDDFAHTVRELYHHLHADDSTLGADLLRVKQVLGEYIEPRTK